MEKSMDPAAQTALAAARRALPLLADVVADAPFTRLADGDLVALLEASEELGRLVDAARVGLTAEIVERSLPLRGNDALCVAYGCRTASDLVTRLVGISGREVSRRAQLGRALVGERGLTGAIASPLPAVAAGFWNGRLGVESAEAIAAGLSAIRHRCDPENFDAAERALAACATGEVSDETVGLPGCGLRFSADLVRQQVQLWAARLDPDGAAPESPAGEARSRIGFGRLKDGLHPLLGGVTPDLRQIMNSVFNTYLSARSRTSFPSEQEQHSSQEEGATSEGGFGAQENSAGQEDTDNRSADEKRADILRGAFDWIARQPGTPTMGGSAPTVTVHVNARDLLDGTGVGWVDGAEAPVSLRTVRQMICAGGLRKVVFGDHGEVLQMGTRERCFTTVQRKAMAARDGGCVIPGCQAPAEWAEAHHVIPWSRGGKTDIDNGVLLCWFDHHEIEHSGWQIRMVKGSPQIKAPPWLDRSQTWRPAGRHRASEPSLGQQYGHTQQRSQSAA